MKPVCLTSTRFNLRADVLRPGTHVEDTDPSEFGTWVESQDPITGDIIKVWVPDVPDDPGTPATDETTYYTIPCMVRGIIEGGVRAAGTTEHWSELYESIELVRMYFPANYRLTNRDRVVNIRNARGQVIWKNEETEDDLGFKATTFDVLGVTPVLDPFGNHIENYALLERSEIQ